MAVRVRYAPSPTGDPHLGNLRTAVYDYLLARHEGGSFMVRVEDTDQTRLVPGSLERILQSLAWLGIEPDEGVYLDEQGKIAERGGYGPYVQSQRLSIYQEYAGKLLEDGSAYRCFCSSERLEEMRRLQQEQHLPPKYDKRCRSLSKEESDRRASAGEPFVIRQAMPEGRQVVLADLIRGDVVFNSDELDDHVLLKSDGFPTYQLANVVDDHLMEITHVLRGEEWIPSAPKNLLLYEAFAWEPPRYAHLPLILGSDKSKLSKRHGAEPVLVYKERGYLPEAVLNVIAFLGWSPGTEEEFFSVDELAKRFSIERVQKSPAVFNMERLDYVNGWYIRQLPVGEVAERMLPYLLVAGLARGLEGGEYASTGEVSVEGPVFGEYLLKVAYELQERLKHFDETAALAWFFFRRPTVNEELRALLVPKKSDWETTRWILSEVVELLRGFSGEWTHDCLEETLRIFIAQKGYKNMEVLWPIRAALTGEPASPGAFEMLAVLGKEEALVRLETV